MKPFSRSEKSVARTERAGREALEFDNDADVSEGPHGAERTDFRLVRELPSIPQDIVYTRTRTVHVSESLLRQNRIVTGLGEGLYADAYRILSTQVLQKLNANGWNTLGVTSPNAGEGKTLTAINLAISLAAEFQHTVLLVDADLRRPGVGDCFGLPRARGLRDHLMADAPVEDLLVHPGIANFVLLPGGVPLVNSSAALGSNKMSDLVKELKSRYASRIVVFDLPPLLHTADVLAFAPRLESALLVVEEARTTRADVTSAVELLRATRLIGAVLNKCTGLPVPVNRLAAPLPRRLGKADGYT